MSLRELRKEAKLSRDALAQESGVSYNTVMHVEQGRKGMRLATASKLATVLSAKLPTYSEGQLLAALAASEARAAK